MRRRYSLASCVVAACLAAAAYGDVSLAQARWLVPEPLRAATNVTSEFRASFESAADGVARLQIAADTVYAVELNGHAKVEYRECCRQHKHGDGCGCGCGQHH